MAGWNDIRQPHDPWDDEDLNPLRLASELLGMIQAPDDPALRAVETLFSVGPNALNQLNRIGSPGEVPAWEQGLNYGDVMRQAGYEGLLADALGLVGDIVEPGFGEIGTALGFIGAPALRRFFQFGGGGTQYMDPNLLLPARGNELRRSPSEQTAFMREIAEDPEGMRDPVMLVMDPATGRYKVGEGNHRVAAGIQAGEPVPVRAVTGLVSRMEGLPFTPGGRLIPDAYGYTVSTPRPSEGGLPTFTMEQVREMGVERMRRMGVPEEEISEAVALLEKNYPSPTVPMQTAGVEADPYLAVRNFARDSGANLEEVSDPTQFVNRLLSQLGSPERTLDFLESNTGLRPEELEELLRLAQEFSGR